ncbi:MAG: DUF192 domain-containing protein [Pseudomonadota bacterium]
MHRATAVSLLLAVAIPGTAWAQAACAPDRLDIRWAEGRESFSVEVADDAAERAKGLMFRQDMPLSSGMLFVYDAPRRVSFWMKNTLIPLDMVFADATGTVTRVQANAVPGDLTPVDGGEGVMFVLELNGGLAARLGIAPGAVLRHPAIPASGAAWPCDG